VTHSPSTPNGQKVYITVGDNYVKIVTQSGERKYVRGNDVNIYKSCDWDKYSRAANGVYRIR